MYSCCAMYGQTAWKKGFGGSNDDHGRAIATAADGRIAVIGTTSSDDADLEGLSKGFKDIVVIVYTPHGEIEWKRVYGGSDWDEGNSIAVTVDGSFFITGITASNDGDFEGLSKGGRDIFVMKIDTLGNVLWKRTIGGSGYGQENEEGRSIIATSDGGCVVTGVASSNDGDLEGMNLGWDDIVVVKLSSKGDVEWKKTYGGSNLEQGFAIVAARDGGYAVTGYSRSTDGDFEGISKGGDDMFVLKLDANGVKQWILTFGGSREEEGASICSTLDGGLVVVGRSRSNDGDFSRLNKGQEDIVVMKLDETGALQWKRTYGGLGPEGAKAVVSTTDGHLVVVGDVGSVDGDFIDLNKGWIDLFVMKLDASGNVRWKKTIGGSIDDVGHAVGSVADGRILVAGSFSSNDIDVAGMSKGEADIIVLSMSASGEIDQKQTFGGNGSDGGRSIVVTGDNEVLVVGHSSSNDGDFKGLGKGKEDLALVVLGNGSDVGSLRTYGGSGRESAASVTQTIDGGFVLVGVTDSKDGDFKKMNKGSSDIIVVKLSASKAVEWWKTYGGKEDDIAESVSSTPDGGFFVTGATSSTEGDFKGKGNTRSDIFVLNLDKNGKVVWKKTFGGSDGFSVGQDENGRCILATADGGCILTGFTSSNDGTFKDMKKGGSDIFVLKLDRQGGVQWTKVIGGSDRDEATSIAPTADGGYIITGYSASNDGDFTGEGKGDGDIIAIRLSAMGEIVWIKTIGGSASDGGSCVISVPDGGFVIAGSTESNNLDFHNMLQGARDIAVVKLDRDGLIQWKRTIGGTRRDTGRSISLMPDGGFALTGFTESNDGNFASMNKGDADIVVVYLDAQGALRSRPDNAATK